MIFERKGKKNTRIKKSVFNNAHFNIAKGLLVKKMILLSGI